MSKKYRTATAEAAVPLMGTGESLGLQHGAEKKAVVPRANCFYNHTKEKRANLFFGSLVYPWQKGHCKPSRHQLLLCGQAWHQPTALTCSRFLLVLTPWDGYRFLELELQGVASSLMWMMEATSSPL